MTYLRAREFGVAGEFAFVEVLLHFAELHDETLPHLVQLLHLVLESISNVVLAKCCDVISVLISYLVDDAVHYVRGASDAGGFLDFAEEIFVKEKFFLLLVSGRIVAVFAVPLAQEVVGTKRPP